MYVIAVGTMSLFLCYSTGKYEVSEAEGVQRGTKIVIHLKGDCYDYAREELVKGGLLTLILVASEA